ncbi:hem-containing dehydratase protein [Penicillium cosmopolitanum]|uniref:Hem-containing dehydratase protein n=1 Tax=Penicillium cosmopolitanum TaxID=1131564 RepID=A0A9W9W363_9EURO|nr:hem-containing dehydratase protein [Penicillium cosmopolitanum]KAJ5397716.1 hem-containing dehydratase protein [Penicillium cosmopolitanum]
MASDTRTYPLRQPAKHNPPPRLHLVFPEAQKQVFTAYIGIELHSQKCKTTKDALSILSEPRSKIQNWLEEVTPISTEQFFVLDDTPNHRQTSIPTQAQAQDPSSIKKSTTLIWACYWPTKDSYQKALANLNLSSLHTSLPESLRPAIGFWAECFTSDIARLETVYSATDYMPGLARLPGTSTTKHLHTGYWGAARDRIPGSGEDLFTGDGAVRNYGNGESAAPAEEGESEDVDFQSSLNSSIKGTNPSDMVHIRSGQFWGNCNEEEASAYLDNLEPKLRGGLLYLWNSPEESGSLGVRYLRNTNTTSLEGKNSEKGGEEDADAVYGADTDPSIADFLDTCPKETCVTAFFRNMADLEKWASKHPSHLAIHAGAVSHGRRFGDARRFRTWHEVSVIRGGEARFEYVNCVDGRGFGRGMVSVQRSELL